MSRRNVVSGPSLPSLRTECVSMHENASGFLEHAGGLICVPTDLFIFQHVVSDPINSLNGMRAKRRSSCTGDPESVETCRAASSSPHSERICIAKAQHD